MSYVLVLYYSRHQHTANMAKCIARGIDQTGLIDSRLRTVASPGRTESNDGMQPPYATLDDLEHASGLAIGSPGHFGNTAAPLAQFISTTSGLWLSGALVDKPFSVFSSTSSMHGGQETSLISMALPWLHHGMVFVGIPFTNAELTTTQKGGTPYGATCVTDQGNTPMSDDEEQLCYKQGQRLARMAHHLETLSKKV